MKVPLSSASRGGGGFLYVLGGVDRYSVLRTGSSDHSSWWKRHHSHPKNVEVSISNTRPHQPGWTCLGICQAIDFTFYRDSNSQENHFFSVFTLTEVVFDNSLPFVIGCTVCRMI